jgi:hypothetical protein
VPQFPHLPLPAVLVVLATFDMLFLVVGLQRFHAKSVS